MLINVNFQKLKKPKIENKNRINDTNKKSLKNENLLHILEIINEWLR